MVCLEGHGSSRRGYGLGPGRRAWPVSGLREIKKEEAQTTDSQHSRKETPTSLLGTQQPLRLRQGMRGTCTAYASKFSAVLDLHTGAGSRGKTEVCNFCKVEISSHPLAVTLLKRAPGSAIVPLHVSVL